MIIRRFGLTLGVSLALAFALALPAAAAAATTELWGSGEFAVRPQTVELSMTGHEWLGRLGELGGGIRWRTWTESRAGGIGTIWINDGIPSYGEGTFHRHSAVIKAWRVRDGHFTRLSARFRGGSEPWKKGKVRYDWRYSLTSLGSGSYTWDR